ncbi:hypothetical protein [Basilea psittacipulmonis]|uniref:Uncharacterized protein n=1 Tax=Basilea psittacipulmonis DSM 24701 TaxID=1072685 RepID=A0A077DGB4_9BURK|nr:hypothetical protein [Basilea psittacipulmonis]AIL33206.1 hypothetical protein IX83_07775 [Basilea psittacipulmonis DSM 24701]
MKFYQLLGLGLAVAVLTACGSSDDPETRYKEAKKEWAKCQAIRNSDVKNWTESDLFEFMQSCDAAKRVINEYEAKEEKALRDNKRRQKLVEQAVWLKAHLGLNRQEVLETVTQECSQDKNAPTCVSAKELYSDMLADFQKELAQFDLKTLDGSYAYFCSSIEKDKPFSYCNAAYDAYTQRIVDVLKDNPVPDYVKYGKALEIEMDSLKCDDRKHSSFGIKKDPDTYRDCTMMEKAFEQSRNAFFDKLRGNRELRNELFAVCREELKTLINRDYPGGMKRHYVYDIEYAWKSKKWAKEMPAACLGLQYTLKALGNGDVKLIHFYRDYTANDR